MTAAIQSMTGFARHNGSAAGCSFTCEIRSVNARGLDLRMRLSPGLEPLEAEIRKLVGRHLTRGAINMTVTAQRDTAGTEVIVNHEALDAVLGALDTLAERAKKADIKVRKPALDGILGLKGVLDIREEALAEDEQATLNRAVLEGVERACADLASVRQAEGQRLANIVAMRIDEIETLVADAEGNPARSREAITERLRRQIGELSEAGADLSEDRLHAEALVLATKADIREELDRLTAHIGAARQLLERGGALGRKLDFLAQEFNREANTLCSKSNDVSLTATGLDLKAAIDQLREQVQNIE